MRRALAALSLLALGCAPGGAVRVEVAIDGLSPEAVGIRAREQGAVAWRLDCLLSSDGTGTCPFEGGDALWSGGASLAFLLEGRTDATLEVEVTALRGGEAIDRAAGRAVIPASGPRVLSLSLRPPSVPRRRCGVELPVVEPAAGATATGLTLRRGADGRAEAFVYARGGLFRLRYTAPPEDTGRCALEAERVPLTRPCASSIRENVLAAGEVDARLAGPELVLACARSVLSVNPDSKREEEATERDAELRTGPVLARLEDGPAQVLFVSGPSWVRWTPTNGATQAEAVLLRGAATALRQLVMRRRDRADLALLVVLGGAGAVPQVGFLWSTGAPRQIGGDGERLPVSATPASPLHTYLVGMNAERFVRFTLYPDADPPTLTPDGRFELGPPVIGDVTGDGRSSALRLAGGQLQFADADLETDPVTTRQPEGLTLTESDLRLANLDGRPGAEILAFDAAGVRVWAFDASGGAMPGFPLDVLEVDGTSALRLAVTDLDGDGTVELVAISGPQVGVVSLGHGSYDADHMPWPMEAQGPGRAGGYVGERDPLAP